MAVGIRAGELSREIEKILAEYGDYVHDSLEKRGEELAKEGVQSLKKASPRSSSTPKGRKHYADNWAKKDSKDVFGSTTRVIYNKTPTYRVAHLLENGHAKRGGGRVSAITHIAPVEEKIVDDFLSKVKGDISV